MNYPGIAKDRSWSNLQGRSHSPNSFSYNPNKSQNTSVHSEHLWNSLEELELFPGEIQQLIKNEERNLSSYKMTIDREKNKVSHEIENMKREIVHNIDDLKISIHSELDRIYKYYMEKYATMKGEIMEVKRMRDEIEIDMSRKNRTYEPKFSGIKDKMPTYSEKRSNYNTDSNANVLKSMEVGLSEMKKFHMLNYIAELQK